MKIAFLLGAFPVLSETFILDQITSLIDRGHDVSIFAETDPGVDSMHPAVSEYGLLSKVRYERLPKSYWKRVTSLPPVWRWRRPSWRAMNVRRYGGLAASLRLAWAVHLMGDTQTFDIVHCHFGALGLKAVLLREVGALRGTIVTAFHGEDIINYPTRFAEGHYQPLFAKGDYFLPVSDRWNDALQALQCPVDRLAVHRMGVDLRGFPLRDAVDRHAEPLRILTVARLVEKKGIADAIRAVARLDGDYEYVIVGDGPLRASLETLVESLSLSGTIRFAGACTRNEAASHMRLSDIFLAPSVTASDGDVEGVPVAIMEAMSTGLPVVSTWHSGIPDLVLDHESGFLVPEGDTAAIALRLRQLAADAGLRTRMGLRGREIVEREFDIEMLTDRLVDHFHTALAMAPRGQGKNRNVGYG